MTSVGLVQASWVEESLRNICDVKKSRKGHPSTMIHHFVLFR